MSKLESIHTLTQKIPCPKCSNFRSVAAVGRELSSSLSNNVICNHCQNKFSITRDKAVMQEFWSQIGKHVSRKKCPKCGDIKIHFEFMCYVDLNDLYYLVRCADNNHYSRLNQEDIQYLF